MDSCSAMHCGGGWDLGGSELALQGLGWGPGVYHSYGISKIRYSTEGGRSFLDPRRLSAGSGRQLGPSAQGVPGGLRPRSLQPFGPVTLA
eukprot:5324214-Pyramimonas_sp.AAC.1